jgi:hypothetical protein
VYYELVGKTDLKGLHNDGVTFEELANHYLFCTEFLYTYISPDEERRTITVIDLAHLSVRKLPTEAKNFIKFANRLLGAHYPEKAAHVYLVNVPLYFSVIWKMVAPVLDPTTRKKIKVVRGPRNVTKALLQHIDSVMLPKRYGGTSEYELGESPEENLINELVSELNKRAEMRLPPRLITLTAPALARSRPATSAASSSPRPRSSRSTCPSSSTSYPSIRRGRACSVELGGVMSPQSQTLSLVLVLSECDAVDLFCCIIYSRAAVLFRVNRLPHK